MIKLREMVNAVLSSVQITFRQKWQDDRLTYMHKLTIRIFVMRHILRTDFLQIQEVINTFHAHACL